VFDNGPLQKREVDRLSADVETLCYDWRRMRTVVERLARAPWWDLHGLTCLYCHAPFDISSGDCKHEIDCVYERSCHIVGVEPLQIPGHSLLPDWGDDPTPIPPSLTNVPQS
jgi:hypothetical protein